LICSAVGTSASDDLPACGGLAVSRTGTTWGGGRLRDSVKGEEEAAGGFSAAQQIPFHDGGNV
jgi:hypothetical protein